MRNYSSKRLLYSLLLLTTTINLHSQEQDSITKTKPTKLPGWTYLVPGSTCFYQKKYVAGSIFSTLEVGGIYLGIKYNNSLKSNSSTPYYNYPLLIGMQAYQTEKIGNFKNELELIKYYEPDFKYDDISENDLYLAPFKPNNIFTPITGGMVLLAGIFLGIEKYYEDHCFADVRKMYFMDRYIPRNEAFAAFGSVSLAASWSAGIGEEYICRNFLMPILDYRFGQKKGLIFSSLIFGGLHFGNVAFAENPDYGATLLQVGEATVLGYFLGRDVQKRDYNIEPAVAAHMWYDMALMAGSFLINPEDNFLGVKVKFKFE